MTLIPLCILRIASKLPHSFKIIPLDSQVIDLVKIFYFPRFKFLYLVLWLSTLDLKAGFFLTKD